MIFFQIWKLYNFFKSTQIYLSFCDAFYCSNLYVYRQYEIHTLLTWRVKFTFLGANILKDTKL